MRARARSIRRLTTGVAIGATAALATALPAQAAGLRNCTELTGHDVDQVGCYELVWADGVEVRMTFANVRFNGNPPSNHLGTFYVIGPQDETPQSLEATFVHDHTVAGVPRQNHGSYAVVMRTFFVVCSAEGITTGACVPTLSPLPGLGDLPLATSVDGHSLTSVEAIEAAADAGLVTVVDTGQLIVGTVSGR
jgi:hypothetical protein